MPDVELSSGRSFSVSSDRSLLDGARTAGVILPHSCRTGRCGICKARVEAGETVAFQAEVSLEPGEAEAGIILTCCRRPVGDLVLDVEDLSEFASLQVRTSPCRIDSLARLRDDVVAVTLRTPPTSRVDYLPGQYVEVRGKNGVRRSYSIASTPRPDGRIELHVRRVPGGALSEYWFDQAAVNDLLYLEGPFGTFALRNSDVDRIIFLATGTGIAPIKAMLEQEAVLPNRTKGKELAVYWGGRTPSDIYWTPALDGISVMFVPTLSRPDETWRGEKGYVHDVLMRTASDLSRTAVYACGSNAMIQSAREALLGAGLLPRNFHSDAFVSSNVGGQV